MDKNGQVTHLSGVVFDITERRKLEDDLHAAVEIRDEFMSVASHELKTPLTALHMQLQLLKRFLSTNEYQIEPKIEKLIRKAFDSTHSLSELLNALLDVTRIRAGKLELKLEKMDLKEAVLKCISQFEEVARSNGNSILVRADSPILGEWDSKRIEQVVSNLLSNAIKYGASKPIEVTLTSDPVSKMAYLQVRDHGIGISKEMQSKIFERFQRAISSDQVTGLGLGLYIVRQIVDAHGGKIQVESELGEGALFRVDLPLSSNMTHAKEGSR